MREHHHTQRRDWLGAAFGFAVAVAALGGIFNYAIRHQPMHRVVDVVPIVPDRPHPVTPPTVEAPKPQPAPPKAIVPKAPLHRHHRHHWHHHHWMIRPRLPFAPYCVEPVLCN